MLILLIKLPHFQYIIEGAIDIDGYMKVHFGFNTK